MSLPCQLPVVVLLRSAGYSGILPLFPILENSLHFVERSCSSSEVSVLTVPQHTYVGKLSCDRWTLHGEPEVRIYCHICGVVTRTYLRLVHAFTATGILPTQYTHFSQFAGIGSVSYWYMSKGTYDCEGCFVMNCCHVSVYKRLGYIDAVAVVAEKSMRHAIELVECTKDYERLGEVRNLC